MNSLPKKPDLTKSQMARIDDLFNNFSRIETNALKFQEFIHLVIDRAMLNNRYTLSLFRESYYKTIERELTDIPDFTSKGDHKMTKQQFVNFLKTISKTLFPTEKDPIDHLFKTLLVERSAINMRDSIEPPKVLMHDETNKRILNENIIEILCSYEKELQTVYCLYNSDNIKYGKLMLVWREIAIQNNKMTSFGLIKFLVDADVIPRLLGPEALSDIVTKVTPPITIKEHNFFHNSTYSQIYDKDIPKSNEQFFEGDPHFYFHEFVLILARLAFETIGKGMDKKEDDKTLTKFFKEHLLIRNNSEIEQKKPLSEINRPFMRKLTQAYNQTATNRKGSMADDPNKNANGDGLNIKEDEDDYSYETEPVNLDLADLYRKLDKELPKIPEEILVQAQNPPPYEKPKIYIGAPVPKDDKKNANKPAPKKPKPNKKDEEPPIQWAGFPPKREQFAQENFLDYNAGMERDVDHEKGDAGTMSDIEVAPTLIREVLYPPTVPPEVVTYLEAAILSHNSANYHQSLKNYDKALSVWTNLVEEIPDEILLFFDYAKGLVFESVSKDDYALNQFITCKGYIEKMPFNSADRAIPYCGIGSVLYKTFDYKWALRSFLKALEIREKILGPQSVDTATMYNNVGCCMFFLERVEESYNYFDIAHAIFELELGPFHYRTLTAKRNLSKCKKYPLKVDPPFSVMWSTLQLNRFPKKKKGKGKKGKK